MFQGILASLQYNPAAIFPIAAAIFVIIAAPFALIMAWLADYKPTPARYVQRHRRTRQRR